MNNEQKENLDLDVEILSEKIKNYDISFKIILIGDSKVGKSSLILKATKNIFQQECITTAGFDFFNFQMKIKEKTINLQIWDTGGQEAYRSLITNFYRNSSLAILVYSIDNKESFISLNDWVKQIKTYSSPDIKIFIIGNKNDLDNERKISYEEGERFYKINGFNKFFETSAKSGFNTKEMFIEAGKMLYDNYIKINKKGNLMNLNEDDLIDKQRKFLKRFNEDEDNEGNTNYSCC